MDRDNIINESLLKNENDNHFRNHFISTWVTVLFYIVYEYLNGLIFNSKIILISSLIFNSLTIIFFKKKKELIAKHIFNLSIHFYLFITIILFAENDYRSMLLIPTSMICLYIFPQENIKSRIFAIVMPGITYLATIFFKSPVSNQVNTLLTIEQMRGVSLFSTYTITLVQFSYFSKYIERLKYFSINQGKLSALGMMASGIAHEINNPLAIIKGKALQVLKKTNDESSHETTPDIEIIIKSADRIHKMVKSLKMYSTNKSKDTQEQIDAFELVGAAVDISRERFSLNGVNLEVDYKQNFNMEGDEIQLIQAIHKLIDNSFESVLRLKEKCVKIEVSKREIKISDSSCYQPKETLTTTIANLLYTKKLTTSINLELSLSKEIIEKNNAVLLFESQENTKYVILFPKKETSFAA